MKHVDKQTPYYALILHILCAKKAQKLLAHQGIDNI